MSAPVKKSQQDYGGSKAEFKDVEAPLVSIDLLLLSHLLLSLHLVIDQLLFYVSFGY